MTSGVKHRLEQTRVARELWRAIGSSLGEKEGKTIENRRWIRRQTSQVSSERPMTT